MLDNFVLFVKKIKKNELFITEYNYSLTITMIIHLNLNGHYTMKTFASVAKSRLLYKKFLATVARIFATVAEIFY